MFAHSQCELDVGQDGVPCAFSCFPNGLLARERCFGHTNIITALYFKHTIWFNDTRNHDSSQSPLSGNTQSDSLPGLSGSSLNV